MKKYSIFHPLWMCFYSKELYRDVISNWKGLGAGYIFMIAILVTVPLTWHLQKLYTYFVENEAPPILEQVHPVSIKDGVLTTANNKPYTIQDSSSGKVIAIVDPRIDSPQGYKTSEAEVLVTRKQLLIKKNAYETRVYTFEKSGDLHLDGQKILSWLKTVQKWLSLAIFPVLLVFFYLLFLVVTLLFSIIALFFSKLLSVFLSFQECYRLSAIALTPYIVLKGVDTYIFNFIPDSARYLMIILTLIYIYFGIKAYKKTLYIAH